MLLRWRCESSGFNQLHVFVTWTIRHENVPLIVEWQFFDSKIVQSQNIYLYICLYVYRAYRAHTVTRIKFISVIPPPRRKPPPQKVLLRTLTRDFSWRVSGYGSREYFWKLYVCFKIKSIIETFKMRALLPMTDPHPRTPDPSSLVHHRRVQKRLRCIGREAMFPSLSSN